MDFSKVKSLTIPEGSVSKITISNKIVWQKAETSPYTELPYLVATDASKAWIDLGIPYQNGCKVEYKTTLKGTANIFGVFYTSERCRGYVDGSEVIFNIGTSASTSLFPGVDGLAKGTVYTITNQANPDIPNVGIVVDDRQQVLTVQTDWLIWDSSPHNMYLFAVNTKNTDVVAQGIRVIHYFKYWGVDNNLLLDLIPVQRNSDGALGMLNKVNGQFLANISTGTFYKEIPANTSGYVVDDTSYPTF